MVLGSSHLPSSHLGRSCYSEDPSAKHKYDLLHVQETYVIIVIVHNTPCLPQIFFTNIIFNLLETTRNVQEKYWKQRLWGGGVSREYYGQCESSAFVYSYRD